MKREITSLLLIILMLVAPIVSAFDHCAGMSVMDTNHSVMQHQSNPGQSIPLFPDVGDNHCQTHSSHCVFHVCDHVALSVGPIYLVPVLTSLNLDSEHFLRYAAPQSALIRPPITIL